ncbi:MAG: carboxypeptidase regulatory-like domain-containing protein [Myxococcota bacterium]
MILLGLFGCEATIGGVVTGDDGGAVPGAVLHADGLEADCDAVTGPDGRFRTRCPPGSWTFEVRHPDYLPGDWTVTVERGEHDVGKVELARIPVEGGQHVLVDGRFRTLPRAPLVRSVEEKVEQRWCVDRAAAPVEVPAGKVRLLDVHEAEWRVFRLDAEGCAYRMRPGAGDHWSFTAERVEPAASEPVGEGRAWVTLELPPGDYVVAEWFAGFFVRDDATKDTWRAAWVRATSPP